MNDIKLDIIDKFRSIAAKYGAILQIEDNPTILKSNQLTESLAFLVGEIDICLEVNDEHGECLDHIMISELPVPFLTDSGWICQFCREHNPIEVKTYHALDDLMVDHLSDVELWFERWWNIGSKIKVELYRNGGSKADLIAQVGVREKQIEGETYYMNLII